MKNYDVIIIGAGLAGLSLGSELAKEFNILVIEKGRIKNEHKTWTAEEALINNAGLGQFITARFNGGNFKFLDKEKIFVHDKLATVDDVAILDYFTGLIRKNSESKILENCEFLDAHEENITGLTIKTTKGLFSSKLIIDCSGVNSPLVAKHELNDKIFYNPVYGGIYDVRSGESDNFAAEIVTTDYPISWFETFPANKDQTLVYTFQYTNNPVEPLSLKPIHEYQIKNCHLKDKLKGKKMVREVYGIIPMGSMKKNAVNGIFFFGDTNLIGAPLAGTGFTNIIQHYKKIAKHLSINLTNSTLKEENLNYTYDRTEQINRDIQSIIGMILINARLEEVGLFFDLIKDLPDRITANMIYLRLNIEEISILIKTLVAKFGLKKLAGILPKKEYMYIAKEIFKTAENIVVENVIEDLFNIQNTKSV